MEINYHPFVNIQKKYFTGAISKEEVNNALVVILEEPWIKRLMVFSDQALVIAKFPETSYLYVSPSILNVFGLPVEEMKDISSTAQLFSPIEMNIVTKISDVMMAKLIELGLSVDEMSRVRASRNYFISGKNGKTANILQTGMSLLTDQNGMPVIQALVLSDVTSLNGSNDHFFSYSIMEPDNSERSLYSERYEDRSELITHREREILQLIIQGRTSESIAQQLAISYETVKTHRKNLLEKTKSEDSVHLVRYAYAQGWL